MTENGWILTRAELRRRIVIFLKVIGVNLLGFFSFVSLSVILAIAGYPSMADISKLTLTDLRIIVIVSVFILIVPFFMLGWLCGKKLKMKEKEGK